MILSPAGSACVNGSVTLYEELKNLGIDAQLKKGFMVLRLGGATPIATWHVWVEFSGVALDIAWETSKPMRALMGSESQYLLPNS